MPIQSNAVIVGQGRTLGSQAVRAARTVEYKPGMDYGVGVDSPSGDARNAAVQGATSNVAGASGDTVSFEMTEITSIEDLQTSLGISAAASGSVGLFSASAKMDFCEMCHFQSNSVFVIVSISVTQAFTSIDKPTIDPAAATLLSQGDTGRFQDMYGDMFVRGIQTGGQYFGVIEVSTYSASDQTTLSNTLSGSYAAFSASGSVSTSFTKAVENRSVKATCFIQGGATSPLPVTPDQMIAGTQSWPGTLKGKGVPYTALLDDYNMLNLPKPPNYIDLQHQQDVLTECANLRNQDWVLINEIDYITANLSQFIQPDSGALATYRNQLAADLNTIAAAASAALNDPTNAKVPTLTATAVQLPKRVDGQPEKPVVIPDWGYMADITGPSGVDVHGNVVFPTAADLGLEIEYVGNNNGPGNEGDVLSISPPAGSQVMSGSTVVVTWQTNRTE